MVGTTLRRRHHTPAASEQGSWRSSRSDPDWGCEARSTPLCGVPPSTTHDNGKADTAVIVAAVGSVLLAALVQPAWVECLPARNCNDDEPARAPSLPTRLNRTTLLVSPCPTAEGIFALPIRTGVFPPRNLGDDVGSSDESCTGSDG